MRNVNKILLPSIFILGILLGLVIRLWSGMELIGVV